MQKYGFFQEEDGILVKEIGADELGGYYLAPDADARITELRNAFETSSTDEENKLRQALQRCIDAIEYTYGHCYGLPSQLIEARDAAKSLMETISRG